MEQRKLYSLSPNEDVTIINLRSKPLVLEIAYINQRMVNSYVLTYHGNQVQAIHRTMADMASLSEALASVGFRCIGLPDTTLKWKPIVLIKTDLGSKLSIMSTKVQPYPVPVFKIHRPL